MPEEGLHDWNMWNLVTEAINFVVVDGSMMWILIWYATTGWIPHKLLAHVKLQYKVSV